VIAQKRVARALELYRWAFLLCERSWIPMVQAPLDAVSYAAYRLEPDATAVPC
jgi:hypothetical protein